MTKIKQGASYKYEDIQITTNTHLALTYNILKRVLYPDTLEIGANRDTQVPHSVAVCQPRVHVSIVI